MYSSQYPTPPPYGSHDQYRSTPPMSPGPAPHAYYSPRYVPEGTTRSSPKVQGHGRRASHAVPSSSQYGNGYASPRGHMPSFGTGFTTATPRQYATPRATPEYVSYFGYSHQTRHRRDTDASPLKRSHRERKRRPSQSARYTNTRVFNDNGYGYDCDYDIYDNPPPPYEQYARHDRMYRDADRYVYDQVPIYDSEPKKARRASHSTRSHPTPTPATPKKSSNRSAPPKATAADAQRAGIPAGFSYKNWDPTEEPIMLLGSVFDANSLGKWIYDWTAFKHGSDIPIAEMAGELWLLLIHLAGKVKKADAEIMSVRNQAKRELVEDFLESGSRLWIRFAKLLKICEEHMWKSAKKENGDKTPLTMGNKSGIAFVECLFGRDKQLETTEKLMTGIRLWSMRFDANVNEILKNPSA